MSKIRRCPQCGSFQLIPIDDNQLECFSCNEVMEDDRLYEGKPTTNKPRKGTSDEPSVDDKGKEPLDEPSES